MILYLVFKNAKKDVLPEFKLQEIPPNDAVQERAAEESSTTTNSNVVNENETTERNNDISVV